jgi:hypothetical protein
MKKDFVVLSIVLLLHWFWPRGQKGPTKNEKVSCYEVLRVEDFSCSLGVLHRGLGINKQEFKIFDH